MNLIAQFAKDEEFFKLLTFQSDVDVTSTALELARDARPLLRMSSTLESLDQIADQLRPAVTRMHHDIDAIEHVCETLTQRFGFGGDAECFDSADSSYLDCVVSTGRGIPIALSLVYMAIGERLGLPISGVAAPAHFLCRFEGARGPVFIDAFRHGRILDPDECLDWIADVSGVPAEAIRPTLAPAHPRAIVLRMLNNLKALHLRHSDWASAELVLRRIVALRPASFGDRRDLAAVSLLLDRPGNAIDLLSGVAAHSRDDEQRQSANEVIASARRLLASWN